MRRRVSSECVRVFGRALTAGLFMVASALGASAQTTLTISDPSQVVFATLRSGSYKDTNIPNPLETRSADSASDYLRRAMLKFDTQSTIPQGTSISSAFLTVTVKQGSPAASRRIAAYQVTTS